MPGQMLISNTAQIESREIDQKMLCKPSSATDAISPCEELDLRYAF